jgi:hypothetical protein
MLICGVSTLEIGVGKKKNIESFFYIYSALGIPYAGIKGDCMRLFLELQGENKALLLKHFSPLKQNHYYASKHLSNILVLEPFLYVILSYYYLITCTCTCTQTHRDKTEFVALALYSIVCSRRRLLEAFMSSELGSQQFRSKEISYSDLKVIYFFHIVVSDLQNLFYSSPFSSTIMSIGSYI